jgi:hypothetical protein
MKRTEPIRLFTNQRPKGGWWCTDGDFVSEVGETIEDAQKRTTDYFKSKGYSQFVFEKPKFLKPKEPKIQPSSSDSC